MNERVNISAVILCAGKGTRMNDNSKNKVCFDCAGIPVIKRIIGEMRAGGVERFVIVCGHLAQNVMDTLDGESGVIYAYQKEQKGTGHAALCGLNALADMGVEGHAIVSMGDKIVSRDVIRDLTGKAECAEAVWGVQPLANNPNGGRIALRGGKPYGVVELADVCYELLAGKDEGEWQGILKAAGLNEKKADKVIKLAKTSRPVGSKLLAGERFAAAELLESRYANAGLYCFDIKKAIETISECGSDNAQGEIYLTDTLEHFALHGNAVLCEVKDKRDMLTYSTREDLRVMSMNYLRRAGEIISDIKSGSMRGSFEKIYGASAEKQETRYTALLEKFISDYGDKKVIISRAPGRINLMGRHIDHRGGRVNVIATDCDTVAVVSPRDDGIVNAANLDGQFRSESFSLSEYMPQGDWLNWLNTPESKKRLADSRGSWVNYIRAAVYRFALKCDMPLLGMDIELCGNIPRAAGLSSSSSIVVAAAEAVTALNSLNITEREFVELCGEGEWFVGSRGGAGDHAAIKCSRPGMITQLGFKPFSVCGYAAFPEKCAVIVADSGIQAKKSEGSRDIFNSRVAAYEFALMYIKRAFPEAGLAEFRDLAEIRPYSEIYRMLKVLPVNPDRKQITGDLPEYRDTVERIFSNHADCGNYDLRGIALYGVSECVRAKKFIETLEKGADETGKMMKISHNGDRITGFAADDGILDGYILSNADPSELYGAYACSSERLDELVDLFDGTDGVYGASLVGAGLGGCVIALVDENSADSVIEALNMSYYDKYGLEHMAYVCRASGGSAVIY